MLLNVRRLQSVAFQLLNVGADLMDLVRNVDALRAVGHAGVAADASVSLAEFRNGPVVADKICPSCLSVILICRIMSDISFVDAFVVMK